MCIYICDLKPYTSKLCHGLWQALGHQRTHHEIWATKTAPIPTWSPVGFGSRARHRGPRSAAADGNERTRDSIQG